MHSLRASPVFALAVLVTLGLAGLYGLMILMMQPPPGFMGMAHFTEPSHRVHDLTFGFLFGTAVVGLLALSSDVALRKLKAGPWKWLQRLNYALFALVIAHAIYYGALLRVTSPSTLLLGLSVIAVFGGQAVGVRLWRRRYSRATPRPGSAAVGGRYGDTGQEENLKINGIVSRSVPANA